MLYGIGNNVDCRTEGQKNLDFSVAPEDCINARVPIMCTNEFITI